MNESRIQILAPGFYKEADEFFFDPKKVAAEGTKRGVALIGEIASNRKSKFNEALIKKLHGQVVYYMPKIAGRYRFGEEDVRIGEHRVVAAGSLPDRMYLFGRWLEEGTESLKERSEDLLGALRLACEAQYGLVSPALHPFYDGNGRVARLLANGILMLNAHELVFYGIKILPVPLVRQSSKGKEDPYVRALEEVNQTRVINPLELYIANLWLNNLTEMIRVYHEKLNGKGKKSKEDLILIGKFENRVRTLRGFIEKNQNKSYLKNGDLHPVPDYFAINHIR